jgi:hypothetical protein
MSLVEVLYASNNNTSTNSIPILSTKYGPVEVVEIVEVLCILKEEDKQSNYNLLTYSFYSIFSSGPILTPALSLTIISDFR